MKTSLVTAKITVDDILRKKKQKKKVTALSTYDFAFGKLADESGIDIVLVGDSVGMVSLGYETTLPVTMQEMLHHGKAVSRAVTHALLAVDLPYGSYQDSPREAVRSGRCFVREVHADAVKLEGGERVLEQVEALVRDGIPVIGHLGMTPQSIRELGGYRVQGRNKKDADKMIQDASRLEAAGAFSVVLECVPAALAERITKKLTIPTIGIGAGPGVDGQILVLHDLLGFKSNVTPRFVRRYADLDGVIRSAITRFKEDVASRKFPSLEESFR